MIIVSAIVEDRVFTGEQLEMFQLYEDPYKSGFAIKDHPTRSYCFTSRVEMFDEKAGTAKAECHGKTPKEAYAAAVESCASKMSKHIAEQYEVTYQISLKP